MSVAKQEQTSPSNPNATEASPQNRKQRCRLISLLWVNVVEGEGKTDVR